MEKIAWLVLGGVTFVAALRAGRSLRAMYVGRAALGALFIVFGALVNAFYLIAQPEYYATFADASPFPFVTDTWNTMVLPYVNLFITVLVIFEATMGVLILSGGRRTQVGLIGLRERPRPALKSPPSPWTTPPSSCPRRWGTRPSSRRSASPVPPRLP